MNIRIGNICQTVIHRVGNKNNSEGIYCSESLSDISGIEEMLTLLIKNSFSFNSSYCFQSIDELCGAFLFLLFIYHMFHSKNWEINKFFLIVLGVFLFYFFYSILVVLSHLSHICFLVHLFSLNKM